MQRMNVWLALMGAGLASACGAPEQERATDAEQLAASAEHLIQPSPVPGVDGQASERPRGVGCPATRPIIDIHQHGLRDPRQVLKEALKTDGATVRLGPDVDLDFTDFPELPLYFGKCVTLTSVAAFDDLPIAQGRSATALISPGPVLTTTAQGRSPRMPGPVLRYGPPRVGPDAAMSLLEIGCSENGEADGARLSGFRLYGPSFGQQSTEELGIDIISCVDVDISNLEVAGWGGAGIRVNEHDTALNRITRPEQVTIHDNFIHNNQRPSQDGHASGYGVNVHHDAWAHVYQNAFDLNRHSLVAAFDSGGYVAEHNLVLKGGGYHDGFGNTYTHAFDVHGSGCDGFGGDAGEAFSFIGNAFQYRKDVAIKLRGKPANYAFFTENIFPHPGLEDDAGDDAIHLDTTDNVQIGPSNVTNFDSFGRYGVCDFDGDEVDDLFLATGRSWWFSSLGEFQWSFLKVATELLPELVLGYFDDDSRCDVMVQSPNGWMFASGGSGELKLLGDFGAPLTSVAFGRFDPNQRDHRIGATRRTTHAFRRARTGQWSVTPLTSRAWQPVASSTFEMNALRFGDFTGDGVTDVLAVENGRWAISKSARDGWQQLNPQLSDPVGGLLIANVDTDDNIDDIFRLDTSINTLSGGRRARIKWWRSKNGTQPWQSWKEYEFNYLDNPEFVDPRWGFVGRFGVGPGGGTLLVGPTRHGQFHSKAVPAGVSPDWTSVYAY